MGPDAMILVFWILSFKPTFSLSSFTFIKKLFSFSLFSAICVGSSAYLRLLIFLPAILIPACASSSPGRGRDWEQEEKGTTEDEMAGWHHRLDGPEFEWTPGVGDGQGGLVCCDSWGRDGQGGLVCCDSWGRKESYTTERLNWTEYSPVNGCDFSVLPGNNEPRFSTLPSW